MAIAKGTLFLCFMAIALLLSYGSLWAGQWQEIDSTVKPSARYGHTMVVIDRTAYLFGGTTDGSGSTPAGLRPMDSAVLNELWMYNFDDNRWAPLNPTPVPPARSDHSAAVTGGKMYVFGGLDANAQALKDMWSYEAASGKWTEESTTNGPTARYNHTAATLSNGTILIFGGQTTGGAPVSDQFWSYNPATHTWTQLPYTGNALYGHNAVVINDNMYVFGGQDQNGNFNNTMLVYNPAQNTWNNIAPQGLWPSATTSAASTQQENQLWIFGGQTGNGTEQNDVWSYNPSTGQFTRRANLSVTSSHAAAVSDPSRNIIIFGGQNGGQPTNTFQQLNTNTDTTPAGSPDTSFGLNGTATYWPQGTESANYSGIAIDRTNNDIYTAGNSYIADGQSGRETSGIAHFLNSGGISNTMSLQTQGTTYTYNGVAVAQTPSSSRVFAAGSGYTDGIQYPVVQDYSPNGTSNGTFSDNTSDFLRNCELDLSFQFVTVTPGEDIDPYWDFGRALPLQTTASEPGCTQDPAIMTVGYRRVTSPATGYEAIALLLNQDGTSREPFNTNALATKIEGWYQAVAMMPDCTIVAAGQKGLTGAYPLLRAYNADGTLRADFNANIDSWLTGSGSYKALAVLNSPTLTGTAQLIAVGHKGSTNEYYGTPAIHAYNEDGTPNTAFNNNASSFIGTVTGFFTGVAIQQNGSIAAVGTIYEGSTATIQVMKFLSNGKPDYTFGDRGIVRYAYSPFVAVGGSGTVRTSSGGITWEQQAPPTGDSLNGITYGNLGNPYFVAVGDRGTILTSTDGASWTARASQTSGNLKGISIFYGYPSQYAAVGDSGTVLLSKNGVDWTSHPASTANTLNGIVYGRSSQVEYLVAVGDNGTVAFSGYVYKGSVASFEPWTIAASPTTNRLRAVTAKGYGETYFVAVGDSGTVVTATGVITWTAQTPPTPNNLNGIIYNETGNLFVAVGDNGTILTSANGTTWNTRSSGVSSNLIGITYGNGMYLATGDDGSMLTSPDGTTWTSHPGVAGQALRGAINAGWSNKAVGIAIDNKARIVVAGMRGPATLVLMRLLDGTATPDEPSIAVSPGIVSFKAMDAGTAQEKIVAVTNRGLADLAIGNIAASNPLTSPFSIVQDNCSFKTLSTGSTCMLTLRFSPTVVGQFNDSFDIPSNDPSKNPVIVEVGGLPSIQVEPAALNFAAISAGNTADMTMTITNRGYGTLTTGSIGQSNGLATPFGFPEGERGKCSNRSLAPNESCAFKVAFSPAVAGIYSDSFDIPSNDTYKNPVVVQVSGAPKAAADQTAIDFGLLIVGDKGYKKLVLTNAGYANLAIASVTGPATGSFTISSDGCAGKTLAPSADCTILIEFAPQGAGVINDAILIKTDDPAQQTVSTALSGEGRVAANPRTLTVSKSGTGTGFASSSPGGIYCGNDCSGTYEAGTVVTLTATAGANSKFEGWQGACSGTTQSCTITMDANKDVAALFAETSIPTGAISINNNAKGTDTQSVTLNLSCTNPAGCTNMIFSNDGKNWSALTPFAATTTWQLTDGSGTKVVYAKFQDGAGNWSDVVTAKIGLNTYLSQYASSVKGYSSQYGAASWSASQATGAPNVTAYGDNSKAWAPKPMNGTKEYIILEFATPVFAEGVVIRETDGNGFVYQVDLLDASDNLHKVWEGVDPSKPGTPVEFDVSWNVTPYMAKGVKIYTDTDHNKGTWEEIDSVQLRGYTQLPQYLLTVVKAGTENGTVSGGNPTGIECGDTCSYLYDASSSVTLVAAPGEGAVLTGWQGPCTGAGQCEFTINGDTTVTAVFYQRKSLALNQGWNFICIPVQPQDVSISVILKDISPNIRVVWGYDNQEKQWLRYRGQGSGIWGQGSGVMGQKNLETLDTGKGYWVYMNKQDVLVINGQNAQNAINLTTGWNLAGYGGSDGQTVSTSLNNIAGKWIIVWGWENGQWYAKAAPGTGTVSAPELAAFNSGKAYWIKAKEAVEWQQ